MPPWRILHRVADAHVGRFVGPFIRSVESARRRISEDDVARSLALGTPSGALVDIYDDLTIAKAAEPAELAHRVYQQIVSATVLDMVDYVTREYGAPAGQLVGRFDVTNPYVLRAARTLTADLVRGVSDQSKQAVRRIIFESVRDGVAPRDAAKLIRQTVGLSARQAGQVGRYRAGLTAAGRKPADVDRLSQKLADRLLRERALTVARTETMRAANRGQQAMWEAMRDGGVVGADFKQRWMTTPDDRLCERCAPMGGKVVELGYLFRETERGVLPSSRTPVMGTTVPSPPLHPRCRCVVVADVGEP